MGTNQEPTACIVVSGNPVNGFKFFGPFPSEVEAQHAAVDNYDLGQWWIAPLRPRDDV